MNYFLISIQFIAFFTYIFYIWKTVGVQKSISDAWYYVKNKSAFNMFAAGIGIPMWAYSLLGFNDASQFVFGIAGFFLFSLAIASTFKSNTLTKIIHFACTGLGIAFTMFGIYLQSGDLKYLIPIGMGTLLLTLVRHPLWWIEIFLCVGLLTKIFLITI